VDFAWSKAQTGIYSHIVHETRTTLGPLLSSRGLDEPFTKDEWRACGHIGLLGLCVPKQYGGSGFDCLTTALAMEAFGYACRDMGLVFAVGAHLFACAVPLCDFGVESLKAAFLPRLCSGELIGANAATEKESGSDIFSMSAVAERSESGYLLSGVKTFVSNASLADVFVVYATTSRSSGCLGSSAFLVDRASEGLRVSEPIHKMGLNSISVASVHFENCCVPEDQLLGKEGLGRSVFSGSMRWERTCLFAGYVGMMQRQLEAVADRVVHRRQFGRSVARFQAVSHKIVDMKLRLESARLLLYRACWFLDTGHAADIEISLAKLAISEAAVSSSTDAIQLFGGIGYLIDSGIERNLRDAVGSTIASGTSNIQREIIARGLGL
jgi:alkylation response protein AidB-like acyl-CoA dehydrogenase